MKTIIIFLLILAGAGGVFTAKGYRVHPENLSYYLKNADPGGGKRELKFVNGATLTGIVEEETPTTVKLNMDGAITDFPKTEIASMEPIKVSGGSFFAELKKNYAANKKLHPLLTSKKEDTMTAAWDRFAMEPSRLAEEMKKKNPGLSQSHEIEKAMAAQAKIRQQTAKQQAAAQQSLEY